jgi:hypothetical protein
MKKKPTAEPVDQTEELTPEEIQAREIEKAAILRDFLATRPNISIATPQARPATPIPTPTPADLEQLDRDLAAARAELAATEAAYQAAVKAEAAIKEQADRERKAHLLELAQHRDRIQQAAEEAAEAIRAATAAEIASQQTQTAERNKALAESRGEASRQALRDQVRPWLHEVEYAMRRARELDQQHRRALEVFAAQTVSTSPAEFPAAIRNALSVKVYRPAERCLEHLNNFLSGARDEYGDHIESVLRRILETGTYQGSLAQLKFAATMAFNRDGVDSIKNQISLITAELSRLYAEGRAAAGTTQSVPDPRTADAATRQQAKRDTMYGILTSSRPTQAVIHEDGERF